MTILPKSVKSVLFIVIQLACIIVIFISGTAMPGNVIYYFLIMLFSIPGLWALLIMKFRFNVAPDLLSGSTLVNSGPYKFIRHPMYTTVLGITLMVVIFSFTYFLLLLWLILLITLLMKLTYEENLLGKEFKGYQEYKSTTKRLIPFLY
jgi:protein-S-isoprenylcysteine O-methyltransferase Ste14